MIAWPLVWWAFDVAVLWAAFKAFGSPPPIAAVILCYFLGSLGNLLPLPGGVGGAEGGMLGAFVASGVDAGLALVAVITYQVISTYMPALPGLAAYVSLKRRMDGWREAGAGARTGPAGGRGRAGARHLGLASMEASAPPLTAPPVPRSPISRRCPRAPTWAAT